MPTPREIIADWLRDTSETDRPYPGFQYADEIIAALGSAGYVIVPKGTTPLPVYATKPVE